MPAQLTREELRQLANDPRVTDADLALLSSQQRQAYDVFKRQTQGGAGSMVDTAVDFGKGVVKGAGQTAFGLGQAVHAIPGVGDATDAVGNFLADLIFGPGGISADQAFSKSPQELEATNTTQKLGKGVEQIAEMFVPGGAVRKAATSGLMSGTARLLPNLGAKGAKVANQVIPKVANVLGDATTAGSVSALHGNKNPHAAAQISGGTTLAGQVLGTGLSAASRSPVGKTLIPPLVGMLSAGAANTVNPGGLASTMGAYGLGKASTAKMMENPKAIKMAQQLLEKLLAELGRGGAGVYDAATGPTRRQLPMGEELVP